MSLFKTLRIITISITFAALTTIAAAQTPVSLAPMLEKVTPLVVNIVVQKSLPFPASLMHPQSQQSHPQNPFLPRLPIMSEGSGVIIDGSRGLIVTNAHVVQNQKTMVVTLKDGRRFHAKLIGMDTGFDIAVIQIHTKDLGSINLGNSDKLHVGDYVAAIGSPFGLTQTVTSGVVSAMNRIAPKIEGFQNFIQTDAPINPGNSGGALVDMQGDLVGINTAILTPIDASVGIGFAIPSNMMERIAVQLIKYGKIYRGMLGVMAQDLTKELATSMQVKTKQGVVITQVNPDTPASKAGLKVGEIITTADGNQIRSAAQLHNIMALSKPGTKMKLTIQNEGKTHEIKVTIANPLTYHPKDTIPFLGGVRLQKFDELEGDGSKLEGVLVVDVADSSDASLGGLIPGDVIVSANGQRTEDVLSLEKVASEKPKQLLLHVARGNGKVFVVIT